MDFLSEPGFEPRTLGFKSNALSIRPTTAHEIHEIGLLELGLGLEGDGPSSARNVC